MSTRDYLFVYGTLRKGYDLKLKGRVAGELEYVGRAKVGGTMYDIGQYPGAVKGKNNNEIVGEVFLVNNPDKVFKVLDKYEGYKESAESTSEFVRKKNRVQLRSGKTINAWIYWYNEDLAGKQKIKYKDYLNYLKNNKTA
jgi:gamma-glutamylcyclotransferase (GGCT)/AIG2-like uncharacterized protein YtfP